MWIVRAILIILIIFLIVAFAYNNNNPEQVVDVYMKPVAGNHIDVPLLTVVFCAFAAGCFLSLMIFIAIYVKQTMDLHSARKRVRALEAEVGILRNRPIEESADLLRGADSRLGDIKSPFSEG
ncbi:MAG: LapA family protein [Candidatus Zixiibacteriota bacterium]|jgi:uncharacterized membrane protein YciS (DUF1049 family)